MKHVPILLVFLLLSVCTRGQNKCSHADFIGAWKQLGGGDTVAQLTFDADRYVWRYIASGHTTRGHYYVDEKKCVFLLQRESEDYQAFQVLRHDGINLTVETRNPKGGPGKLHFVRRK
jgi:hypothetical protein